jgi:hypothetical protein
MKLKYLSTLLFLFLVFNIIGQDSEKLQFKFSTSFHNYQMDDLNTFLLDTSTIMPSRYDSVTVNNGVNYSLSLSYRFTPLLGIGVEGGYQSGVGRGKPHIEYVNQGTGEQIDYFNETEIKTRAYTLGLTANLSLDYLFGFYKSESFVKKLDLSFELAGGIAFSKLSDFLYNPYSNYEDRKIFHKSTDFYGNASLNIGYQLTSNKLFSSIGLKFGYQLLRTKPVKSDVGTVIQFDGFNFYRDTKLNFSGLFIGTYFTLGK